ncbi:hypothetical protein [Umezawaea sp. Da 62-37]|uniref:hypothetical protein n=1 Tax=Umezawaea sp. Da 62-37 TaxID=3075927 RepID=UPI0028F6E4CF|nr:hypothetical protein [Umezawaea sp. Da 62-37]WNV82066.1 hypothetical protein RM788_28050 [Umezawaea sp. Da 62-37]
MHYVFFIVSALAGAAGFGLLRWSASRGPRPAPPPLPPPPPLAAEPAEQSPSPPPERTLFARPLRITIAVDRPGQDPESGGGDTITLPADNPAAMTTYLVASVDVEVNDFFTGFTAVAQRASGDLHDCDVVVRGDGSHVSNSSRRVLTRASMPLGVLMEDDTALTEECARALVDPTRRRAFEVRVAEAVRRGGVLRWLEQHELALAHPSPDDDPAPPKPPWQPRHPPGPPDQRKWPFVFEQQQQQQTDEEARRPS